jgi:hypothetical protein
MASLSSKLLLFPVRVFNAMSLLNELIISVKVLDIKVDSGSFSIRSPPSVYFRTVTVLHRHNTINIYLCQEAIIFV